ncbi:hypothetical protein HW555_004826, partial [Spodoptera exigua]
MPKQKKQKVWRHYHSLPDKSVKCTFCSKMYRVPNVTKMGTHLLKCPKCPLVIRNELTESCEETSLIASNTTNSAITEGGYVTSTPSDATPLLEFTEEKKRRLTKLLSKAIYVTGSPLSMVEHPLWREFFKELQPLFELPTRKVVNLQKAFDLVKLEHPNVITLNCVAHTLNLLCHDIMKEDAIEAFISVAIDVIKSVKKSQILCALFKQIIAEKGSGEQLKLPSKTRWGSYFHAVRSLQNSKAALQCLAVHEDAKMIPADIKAHLLDEEFWKMIDESTAILERITDYIFKLEGNESYINDVYMAFKDIKSRLVFLLPGFSSLFDDNIRDRILNAVDKRRENCIKPIHLAAYMLDPKCQGIEMNEDEEIIAMDFIHEKGRQLNLEVITDLANYRAREGFWAKSFVWASLQNMKPLTWWKGICKNKALSKVAACLLTAPCTSAATKRTFSIHGNIHSLKRNSPSTIKNIEPQPSTSGRNTRQIEFCDVTKILSDNSDLDKQLCRSLTGLFAIESDRYIMPAVKCGGCAKYLSPIDAAKCNQCDALYHRACVCLPSTGPISTTWRCPECNKNLRRDNKADTPVRARAAQVEEHLSSEELMETSTISCTTLDTTNNLSPDLAVELRQFKEELRGEFRLMHQEFQQLRSEMAQLKESIKTSDERMESLEKLEISDPQTLSISDDYAMQGTQSCVMDSVGSRFTRLSNERFI